MLDSEFPKAMRVSCVNASPSAHVATIESSGRS